jgi:crotonobetainyl-CoA:carnitine CoA-transferase CaiB-like acyl-CoA transferase
MEYRRGAPVLGGDTLEVLAEFGITQEDIEELIAKRAAIQSVG